MTIPAYSLQATHGYCPEFNLKHISEISDLVSIHQQTFRAWTSIASCAGMIYLTELRSVTSRIHRILSKSALTIVCTPFMAINFEKIQNYFNRNILPIIPESVTHVMQQAMTKIEAIAENYLYDTSKDIQPGISASIGKVVPNFERKLYDSLSLMNEQIARADQKLLLLEQKLQKFSKIVSELESKKIKLESNMIKLESNFTESLSFAFELEEFMKDVRQRMKDIHQCMYEKGSLLTKKMKALSSQINFFKDIIQSLKIQNPKHSQIRRIQHVMYKLSKQRQIVLSNYDEVTVWLNQTVAIEKMYGNAHELLKMHLEEQSSK